MPRHVTNRTWTPEHDARLLELIESGASPLRCAAAMKRSLDSVKSQARKLGKPFESERAVRKRIREISEPEQF